MDSKNINIKNKLIQKIYDTKFIENPKHFPGELKASYNINKGEQIVLCIVDYSNMVIYDLNTLMYYEDISNTINIFSKLNK